MSESDDLYVGGFDGYDQLDPSETLTGDNTEDPLDAGYTLPDREPRGLTHGTTTDETRRGESLDELLAEEEPDVGADADEDDGDDEYADDDSEPERRAGRLVAPDEGAHPVTEDTEVATDVGRAGSAASAEEAAMHVENDEQP